MKVSLDTNAYSRLGTHHEPLLDLLNTVESVHIPATVLGELYAGFHLGTRYAQNCRELAAFLELSGVSVVPVDEAVADRYGMIVKQLRAKGTPIPSNDIWIAACTFETGSRLVTYDNHFGAIDGLAVLAP